MAAKKAKSRKVISKNLPEEVVVTPVEKMSDVKDVKKDDDLFGGELDPAEEKALDKILMVIVWFILGWLGLSVLLVFRGYLCSEVVKGAFFCAGL